MKAKLSALSSYAPEKIITNQYFEDIVETNNEWITSRTGIIERRYAGNDEYTGDLCYKAAQKLLLENPELNLEGTDFIIVSTTTPDHTVPSVSSQLQYRLGINNPGTIDLSSACAGFIYGIILAKSLIMAGTYRKVLVFGADTLSKVINFFDRSTCILFGDGAGVALIEASVEEKIMNSITGTNGGGGQYLYRSSLSPEINGIPVIADSKSHQNGRIVFKWAVQTAINTVREVLAANNTTLKEVDFIILHSANLRIIEAVSAELDYPLDRMPESIRYFGNTSSASIPLAFHQAVLSGKIKRGHRLLLAGYGGGLTYAGILIAF